MWLLSTSFYSLFQDSQLEINFFPIYFIHIFFLYCTVIKTSKLHYHIWKTQIVTEGDKECIGIIFLNRNNLQMPTHRLQLLFTGNVSEAESGILLLSCN